MDSKVFNDEEDYDDKTYTSIPFGFIQRKSYDHATKHCNIQSVTFNTKAKEYIILDSRGVSSWVTNSIGDTSKRLLEFEPYKKDLLRDLIFCSAFNVYFALSKEFNLKVYSLNFIEVSSLTLDGMTISSVLFNEKECELITFCRTKICFVKYYAQLTNVKCRLVLEREFSIHEASITSIGVFDEKLQRIYMVSDYIINCYNCAGKQIFKIKSGGEEYFSTCAFSVTSNVAIAGCLNGQISIFSSTGGLLTMLLNHSRKITAIYIHPQDSNMFISSSLDGTIKIFSLHIYDELYSINVFTEGIHWMKLQSSNTLYCGSHKAMQLYNLNYSFEFWATVRCKIKALNIKNKVPKKSTHVVAYASDHSIRIYRKYNGKNKSTILPPPELFDKDEVLSFAYDRIGGIVYLMFNTEIVWIYSLRTDPATRVTTWNLKEIIRKYQTQHEVVTMQQKESKFGKNSFNVNQFEENIACNCVATMMKEVTSKISVQERFSYLLCGMANGTVFFCDPTFDNFVAKSFIAHPNSPVQEINVFHGSYIIEIATLIRTKNGLVLKIWNSTELFCLHEISIFEAITVFTFNLLVYAIGYADGKVHIERFGDLKKYNSTQNSCNEHLGSVLSVDLLESKEILCSCGKDHFIRIWNYDRILLQEIKFDSTLSGCIFLDKQGTILFGFKSQLFIIPSKLLHLRALDSAQSDTCTDESFVYEDPHVRQKYRDTLKLPNNSTTLANYLVPYPYLGLDKLWLHDNNLENSLEEMSDAEDGLGSFDESSLCDSYAPTEVYQDTEYSGMSRSSSRLIEFPTCDDLIDNGWPQFEDPIIIDEPVLPSKLSLEILNSQRTPNETVVVNENDSKEDKLLSDKLKLSKSYSSRYKNIIDSVKALEIVPASVKKSLLVMSNENDGRTLESAEPEKKNLKKPFTTNKKKKKQKQKSVSKLEIPKIGRLNSNVPSSNEDDSIFSGPSIVINGDNENNEKILPVAEDSSYITEPLYVSEPPDITELSDITEPSMLSVSPSEDIASFENYCTGEFKKTVSTSFRDVLKLLRGEEDERSRPLSSIAISKQFEQPLLSVERPNSGLSLLQSKYQHSKRSVSSSSVSSAKNRLPVNKSNVQVSQEKVSFLSYSYQKNPGFDVTTVDDKQSCFSDPLINKGSKNLVAVEKTTRIQNAREKHTMVDDLADSSKINKTKENILSDENDQAINRNIAAKSHPKLSNFVVKESVDHKSYDLKAIMMLSKLSRQAKSNKSLSDIFIRERLKKVPSKPKERIITIPSIAKNEGTALKKDEEEIDKGEVDEAQDCLEDKVKAEDEDEMNSEKEEETEQDFEKNHGSDTHQDFCHTFTNTVSNIRLANKQHTKQKKMSDEKHVDSFLANKDQVTVDADFSTTKCKTMLNNLSFQYEYPAISLLGQIPLLSKTIGQKIPTEESYSAGHTISLNTLFTSEDVELQKPDSSPSQTKSSNIITFLIKTITSKKAIKYKHPYNDGCDPRNDDHNFYINSNARENDKKISPLGSKYHHYHRVNNSRDTAIEEEKLNTSKNSSISSPVEIHLNKVDVVKSNDLNDLVTSGYELIRNNPILFEKLIRKKRNKERQETRRTSAQTRSRLSTYSDKQCLSGSSSPGADVCLSRSIDADTAYFSRPISQTSEYIKSCARISIKNSPVYNVLPKDSGNYSELSGFTDKNFSDNNESNYQHCDRYRKETDLDKRIKYLEQKLSGQRHRFYLNRSEEELESERMTLMFLKNKKKGVSVLPIRKSGVSIPNCRNYNVAKSIVKEVKNKPLSKRYTFKIGK